MINKHLYYFTDYVAQIVLTKFDFTLLIQFCSDSIKYLSVFYSI